MILGSLACQTLYLTVKGLVIDRAYNRIKGNTYGSVVCLHPLVVIGAPTLVVICATVQAASQRRILSRRELLPRSSSVLHEALQV